MLLYILVTDVVMMSLLGLVSVEVEFLITRTERKERSGCFQCCLFSLMEQYFLRVILAKLYVGFNPCLKCT